MSRRVSVPGCGCIALALPIALIWGGAQGIHEAAAFQKPVVLSYTQFIQRHPSEGWFTIKGGVINVPEACWEVSKYSSSSSSSESSSATSPSDGPSDKVFVPLQDPKDLGGENKPPLHLLVSTGNASTLGTVKEMLTVGNDEKKATAWAEKNVNRLFEQRDVTGMVQAGINSSESTREAISKVQGQLAPNYLILDENKKPDFFMASAMLGGGIGLVALYVLIAVGMFALKRNRTE